MYGCNMENFPAGSIRVQPICMEFDLFEEVHICCMARSLRSLCQVATLRHGHMARRSASLLQLGH